MSSDVIVDRIEQFGEWSVEVGTIHGTAVFEDRRSGPSTRCVRVDPQLPVDIVIRRNDRRCRNSEFRFERQESESVLFRVLRTVDRHRRLLQVIVAVGRVDEQWITRRSNDLRAARVSMVCVVLEEVCSNHRAGAVIPDSGCKIRDQIVQQRGAGEANDIDSDARIVVADQRVVDEASKRNRPLRTGAVLACKTDSGGTCDHVVFDHNARNKTSIVQLREIDR